MLILSEVCQVYSLVFGSCNGDFLRFQVSLVHLLVLYRGDWGFQDPRAIQMYTINMVGPSTAFMAI